MGDMAFMNNYPPGMTTADLIHVGAIDDGKPEISDRVYNLAVDIIETRALGEILLATRTFVDWVDDQDAALLAKLLAYSLNPAAPQFMQYRDDIAKSYYAYRLRMAQNGREEWNEALLKAEES